MGLKPDCCLETRTGFGKIVSKLQRGMKTRIKMKASTEVSQVADIHFLLLALSIISPFI